VNWILPGQQDFEYRRPLHFAVKQGKQGSPKNVQRRYGLRHQGHNNTKRDLVVKRIARRSADWQPTATRCFSHYLLLDHNPACLHNRYDRFLRHPPNNKPAILAVRLYK
jgi:hypothetical protein